MKIIETEDTVYKYDDCIECGVNAPMDFNETLCSKCREEQNQIDKYNEYGFDYMLEEVFDKNVYDENGIKYKVGHNGKIWFVEPV